MAEYDDFDRADQRLQAYHDGELAGFARFWMERRIARSADLRARLAELDALSSLVRQAVPAVAGADLWDEIAPRLAAVDVERGLSAGRGRDLEVEAGNGSGSGLGWLFGPVGAFAAAGAAAIALAFVLASSDTAPVGVVHWLDSGDRNVMVLDGEDDVTVIWVFDPNLDGAALGGRSGAA
jgi:anti-sigma factor RsiW